jgi:hypothetical protein
VRAYEAGPTGDNRGRSLHDDDARRLSGGATRELY